MSLFSRLRRRLALTLRPGEPAPDARDLNLAQRCEPPTSESGPLQLESEQDKRRRLARWRAGPWQQK